MTGQLLDNLASQTEKETGNLPILLFFGVIFGIAMLVLLIRLWQYPFLIDEAKLLKESLESWRIKP